ncbi:MAG: protein kinase domain-containing protein [Chloroflexota bacterium]
MSRPTWIGKKLGGRYLIQEMLGQGGMSAVYKAMDENLNRVVAVKLIHPHLSTDPEFVRRFEEEARAVAQLRHPNIIQVFDFDHDDDVYYIVFEFVPGETLQDRLKRLHENDRRMDIEQAISIGAQLADALDYAHSRNMIHRDVKPANVMLNVNNDPVLMDFGIVKIMGGTQHTATGAVMGTARYMSPEQIKGERIDERTDLYSLGVLLFEMAGGRAPFEADSAMTIMMMHVNDPVPNLRQLRPEVPPGLFQVITKALNKDKEQRFGRASEMAKMLRHPGLSATAPSPAAQATIVEPAPKPKPSEPEARPTPEPERAAPEQQTPAHGSTGPAAIPTAEREPGAESTPPASVASPSGAGGARLLKRPALIGGAIGLVVLAIVCVAGASLLLNSGLLGGNNGDDGTPVAVGDETPDPDTEEVALETGAEETAAASTSEAEEAGLEQTAEAEYAALTATAEYEGELDAQATTDESTRR